MAAGYLVLFLLGVFQGLIGSFQYGRRPRRLIAILLAVIIFVTCVGCGWGIGTFGAGLLPAAGLDPRVVHARDAEAERQRDHHRHGRRASGTSTGARSPARPAA